MNAICFLAVVMLRGGKSKMQKPWKGLKCRRNDFTEHKNKTQRQGLIKKQPVQAPCNQEEICKTNTEVQQNPCTDGADTTFTVGY